MSGRANEVRNKVEELLEELRKAQIEAEGQLTTLRVAVLDRAETLIRYIQESEEDPIVKLTFIRRSLINQIDVVMGREVSDA